MSGIFPTAGVNFSATLNATDISVTGGQPLYYAANLCNPRFDPAQANAVISEIVGVSEKAGLNVNCNRLDNLALGICEIVDKATCGAGLASQAQINAMLANPDTHYVVVCLPNGTPVRVPVSALVADDDGGGGGGTPTGCPADPDGVIRPIGTTYSEGLPNGQADHTQGQTTTNLSIGGVTVGGTWQIISESCTGTEGDCPSPTWQKISC